MVVLLLGIPLGSQPGMYLINQLGSILESKNPVAVLGSLFGSLADIILGLQHGTLVFSLVHNIYITPGALLGNCTGSLLGIFTVSLLGAPLWL